LFSINVSRIDHRGTLVETIFCPQGFPHPLPFVFVIALSYRCMNPFERAWLSRYEEPTRNCGNQAQCLLLVQEPSRLIAAIPSIFMFILCSETGLYFRRSMTTTISSTGTTVGDIMDVSIGEHRSFVYYRQLRFAFSASLPSFIAKANKWKVLVD